MHVVVKVNEVIINLNKLCFRSDKIKHNEEIAYLFLIFLQLQQTNK